MPTPSLTIDELVATIQRSTLPTVVVEGSDDVIIYRWMEAILSDHSVDFLGCNSRSMVLSLFDRRDEFRDKKVAFVADQDMWVFSGPPTKYSDIIFTRGYSIENDVLSSRAADRLFNGDEKKAFERILSTLGAWFAFEASQCVAGCHFVVDVPLRQIMEMPSYDLSRVYVANRRYIPAVGAVCDQIRADPILSIRGKNVLDAYTFVLNSEIRPTRYARRAILEMCVKFPDTHDCCDRLVAEIRNRLGLR